MTILIVGGFTVGMTWATVNVIAKLHTSYLNIDTLVLLQSEPRNEFGYFHVPARPPVLPYDPKFEARDDYIDKK